MSDLLLKKIINIEKLLQEVNAKIDNFLGFEELSNKEIQDLDEISQEMKEGNRSKFDEVFQG